MTINLTNWMTTLGGFMAGIPSIVLGSGLVLTPRWHQILAIVGGIGVLLIGLAAKDANTHSTQEQVAVATQKEAAKEVVATKP